MEHIDSDNVHARFVQGLEAFEARVAGPIVQMILVRRLIS